MIVHIDEKTGFIHAGRTCHSATMNVDMIYLIQLVANEVNTGSRPWTLPQKLPFEEPKVKKRFSK